MRATPARELAQAKTAADQSTQQANEDLKAQSDQLHWERTVIVPEFRRLREKNHVASAIIKLIEGRAE